MHTDTMTVVRPRRDRGLSVLERKAEEEAAIARADEEQRSARRACKVKKVSTIFGNGGLVSRSTGVAAGCSPDSALTPSRGACVLGRGRAAQSKYASLARRQLRDNVAK